MGYFLVFLSFFVLFCYDVFCMDYSYEKLVYQKNKYKSTNHQILNNDNNGNYKYNQYISPKPFQDKREKDINDFRAQLKQSMDVYGKEINGILKASENKNIIVSIGNTGAGKSTLLNLLTGQDLAFSDVGYTLASQNLGGFEIGIGSNSQTLIPKFSTYKGCVFFDLPGLEDTRGHGIAFLNAVCIKEIITNARSIRFLFVEGKGSLETNRGERFKQLLTTIFNLLGDKSIFKDSSLFVLSQAHTINTKLLVDDFMRKKLDKELLLSLEEFVSLKEPYTIFPFLHPSNFMEEDFETGKRVLNYYKAKTGLKSVRESIERGLSRLVGVRINEINQTALLKSGTQDLVAGLFRMLADDILQNSSPNIEGISLAKLKHLQSNFREYVVSNFEEQVKNQPEFFFIERFDKNLYKTELSASFVKLNDQILIMERKLKGKILSEEKAIEQARANKIIADKIRLREKIEREKEAVARQARIDAERRREEEIALAELEQEFKKLFVRAGCTQQ